MKKALLFGFLLAFGLLASFASAHELAQGKNCDQSDYYVQACPLAFDSINNTDWTISSSSSYISNSRSAPSATDTSNVTVDLNASGPYLIGNVEVYAIGGPAAPYWADLWLYSSTDNSTWTLQGHITGNTNAIRVFNASFTARYVRIGLANNTGDPNGFLTWLGVYEGTVAPVAVVNLSVIKNGIPNGDITASIVNVNFTNSSGSYAYFSGFASPEVYYTTDSLPTGTVTANVSATGYAGYNDSQTFIYNASVQANLTVGLWKTQNFYASNNMTAAAINTFSILFSEASNSSHNFTFSTTNGTVSVSLAGFQPFGTYSVTVSSAGFGTGVYSMPFNASSEQNQTLGLTPASLTVNTFDELTLLPIYFNITVSNSTNSTTWLNQTNPFYQGANNISTGSSVRIAISEAGNNSYYARDYYAGLNSTTAVSINAYLLPTSASTIFVRFHVQNTQMQPIANATVNILKVINGSASTVGQGLTDSSGVASFYMELNALYYVSVTASGYLAFYQPVNPTSNDYQIILGTGATTGGYVSTFQDISWTLSPYSNYIFNSSQNFTFVIASSNSSLNWFSMSVDYGNGTNAFYSLVSGSAAGGMIYYDLPASNLTVGNVSVTISFQQTTSATVFNSTRIFFVYAAVLQTGTLEGLRTDLGNSGMSKLGLAIISLFLTMLIAIFVGRYNTGAGVAIALICLIVFSVGGWLDLTGTSVPINAWGVVLIAVLAGGGWLYLQQRV